MDKRVRILRKFPTDAEKHLWEKLRRRQIMHCRFRRQHRLGLYIVDFVCLEHKLIVEADGGQHGVVTAQQRDETRTKWLQARGYRVIRFWNNEVLENCEGVLTAIQAELNASNNPPP